MSDDARSDLAARVRRVDDRLGLALARTGLSARSLVTYARDHVTVRTPSRPDLHDGNTLDLERPPTAEALGGWVERFERTVANLGVRHVQLRWETPLSPSAGPVVPDPDPELAAACAARGFALEPATMLLLDRPVEPPAAPAELVAVDAPAGEQADLPTDRRWYAASVLYRYEHGDSPDDWRATDDEATAANVELQRELATAGRAQLWLAMRHGTPVGRLTVVHDRQGLAVVDDVIVHPAHRRLGIAAALTYGAVVHHLAGRPDDRIGLGAEPGSSADRLYRRVGFGPHATVWTARRELP